MGFREIFKQPRDVVPIGDRKKPNMIIIWIIIAGIVILAFGDFGTEKEEKKVDTEANIQTEIYEKNQAERLEKILKRINGAGEVSVFISIESGGEKILARDNKSKTSKEEGEGAGLNYDEENESAVVMSGKGSLNEPYVVEEKTPQVNGVLVVAKGAADEKVRLEIYEAVKAVYGLSAHRIRVTY